MKTGAAKYITLPLAFTCLLAVALLLAWLNIGAVLLWIALVPMGAILAVRGVRFLVKHALWRLRNRLILTYVFIAVVPIVLILALAAVGTWMIVGQIAVYLVTSKLERHALLLEDPAHFLAESSASDLSARVDQVVKTLRSQAPGLELIVSDGNAAGGETAARYPANNDLDLPGDTLANYTGYVEKNGRVFCFASARSGSRRAVLVEPMNAGLLMQLEPGIGRLNVNTVSALTSKVNLGEVAGAVPPAYNFLDFETPWGGRIPTLRWQQPELSGTALLVLQTRPSAVFEALFSGKMDDAQGTLTLFLVTTGLLLLVEVLSLVVGVSLARSITQSVAGLYAGTTNIAKGNFAWRIPVKGQDQLAALGNSFNKMTAQLEESLSVAKEKERLQSELKIASEVQEQLFPGKAPKLNTIELLGSCQPARMVSGDYFDYIRLPDGNLALAIGDVAGKGISAALLMASIQSILRTLLASGLAHDGGADAGFSTAHAVEQLNRQLYENTAPSKYATFFFGVYEESTRMLKYTNAGHLPPLLFKAEGSKELEATGTVVGLFPSVRYEERHIEIAPGDVLMAFTDGITEAENSYGEEFGAERLAEIVKRSHDATVEQLVARIFEAVALWSHAPEQADDMTLLIARGI